MAKDGRRVKILPLHVANKIAAGEVVERPASVVKELVENAIDAGSSNIKVSVSDGGRKLIAVADDGCGMDREDALLSLERQATSKILDVGDIENIDTLGFRGEAIPSIASVSRFSMTTRRRDSDEGVRLCVDAGSLVSNEGAGCPPGTIVEVRDLFCNVPARRKFLRAKATEENRIKRIFEDLALSRPDIGFSLSIDGREAYRLAPAAGACERMREIFGPDAVAGMVPLEFDGAGGVSVTGFIERPAIGSSVRHDQYIFINGRAATTPQIAYALKEAYPSRAGESRPALVMFVNLPNCQVDVNVHPTKREVRSRNGAAVKDAVTAAVLSAIAPGTRPAVVPAPAQSTFTSPSTPAVPSPDTAPSPAPAEDVPSERAFTVKREARPLFDARPPTPEPVQQTLEETSGKAATEGNSAPWKRFRYLAQTESGFLLIETEEGLVTINPKAARERIIYEKLLRKDGGASVVRQTLLIPEIVKLSPSGAGRIAAAIDAIRNTGFAIEEFGQDTFKIDAMPQAASAVAPAALLSTIAQDLAEGKTSRSREGWREELVAKSVAKSCSGMSAKMDEAGAVRLVEELGACRMPYLCPRGKPVMVFTSNRELDRKFNLN